MTGQKEAERKSYHRFPKLDRWELCKQWLRAIKHPRYDENIDPAILGPLQVYKWNQMALYAFVYSFYVRGKKCVFCCCFFGQMSTTSQHRDERWLQYSAFTVIKSDLFQLWSLVLYKVMKQSVVLKPFGLQYETVLSTRFS